MIQDNGNWLAPFKTKSGLTIRKVANGGWVAYAEPDQTGVAREIVGAFTTAGDLLDALRAALMAEG